jgi:hypothetical protein
VGSKKVKSLNSFGGFHFKLDVTSALASLQNASDLIRPAPCDLATSPTAARCMHRRNEIHWALSSMMPKAVPVAPFGLRARQ